MSVVPKNPVERVQFYEDHISPLTANVTAIGLSSAEVTDLSTNTAAARTAYDAQQAAVQSMKSATEAFHNAIRAMSVAGDAAIAKIRGKALTTGNPNVYVLAQIPAPKTPAWPGNPGKPFDFTVEIGTTGDLNLKWKNSNASGAVYQIFRRLGGTGEFTYLGGVGMKKFTDSAVPAGTPQVQYQIQAVRSTGLSEWALYVVNLGSGANALATVTEGVPAKIAA